MAGFKRKFPLDNTFTTSETPVGDYERQQSIKHIAESIRFQGLRPKSEGAPTPLYAEAYTFLGLVDEISDTLPQPDSKVWPKYGKAFGKYCVIACSWQNINRVHMLHRLGNVTVHYKKYLVKGEVFFIELTPQCEPVKGTKMTEEEFYARLVRMTRSPYPKQVESVARAVTEYVRNALSNQNDV